MKRVLSSFLIIIFAFSILTGCSGSDKTERVNLSNKVSFDVPAYWISGQHDGEEFREKLELSGNVSAQDRFYASYDGPGLHLNAQHYADSFGEANDKIVDIKQEIQEFDDFSAYHFTYRFSDDDTKAELYAFDAYPDGCLTLAILSYPGSQMSDEERSDKLLEVMNSVYVIGEPDDSIISNEEANSNKTDSDSSSDESLWSSSDPLAGYYQELAEIFHADATYEKAGEGEVRFIIPCADMSFGSFYDFYSDILVSTIAMSQTNVSGTSIDKIYVQIQDPDQEVVMETMLDYSTEPARAATTQINPKYQELLEQVLEKRRSE